MTTLGRLERVADVTSIWPHEERDFSSWLAKDENLSLLSEALGLGAEALELELEGVEVSVGGFRADILCRVAGSDDLVLIENQYGATDHDHLGKLATYGGGLGAKVVVWVAERLREEHRAALDWLNAISDDSHAFFGVELQLWRIGDSLPALRFNVVARPNQWARAVGAAARRESIEPTALEEQRRRYWTGLNEALAEINAGLGQRPATTKNWHWFGLLRSGIGIEAVTDAKVGIIRVELYLGKERAERFFRALVAERAAIEDEIGSTLEWRAPSGKHGFIVLKRNADPTDETDWRSQHLWLAQQLERFRVVFHPRLRQIEVENASADPVLEG